MPFCFWCFWRKRKDHYEQEFEDMNEDVTDLNEMVRNFLRLFKTPL